MVLLSRHFYINIKENKLGVLYLMKSFLQFLEEKIQFAYGRDQDYTVDPKTIIFFSEDDIKTYVENGKTHGVQSHAIKHLVEFLPETVKQLVGQARQIIKQYAEKGSLKFCGLYLRGRSFKDTNPLNVVTQAKDGAILNTLDMINDKYVNKKQLQSVESSLFSKVIKSFEKNYEKEIQKRISKAVDLDKASEQEIYDAIDSTSVVKFSGMQNNAKYIWYLDLKDNAVIMESSDMIRTMYKYNKPGIGKQTVLNFLSKMKNTKIASKTVSKVFRNL